MLEALNFVKGAVAKKDYQPALTHFRISGGRVKGYNGIIALSTPIELDITATPQAIPFVKAVERCQTTTAIHLTPTGLLSIKSGKFSARIECFEESDSLLIDSIEPEGVGCEFPGAVINALKVLEPFIGDDASRPWANGVLLRGRSAYATNNIVIVEYWLGMELPEVNIPSATIRELLRLRMEPLAVTLSENTITFHFEGDRWLRSQLLATTWPDVIDRILGMDADLFEPPVGLFDAIETLKPFVDDTGRIFFRDGLVSTSLFDGQGASVELEESPSHGAFHWEHLLSLQGVMQTIDLTKKSPSPCPFRGERIRGVILGMVDA